MKRLPGRIAASLILVALLGAGCAKAGSQGSGGIGHPTGSRDVVLRIELEGGFIGPAVTLSRVPQVTLYGDGTMIVPAPVTASFPGPALPSLVEVHLTEAGVQAVLRAATAAGLLGPSGSFGLLHVTDLPTTVFTINADGRHHRVSVYGLGAETNDPQLPAGERQARLRLLQLDQHLGDYRRILPAGSVGPDRPFRPSDIRVFVDRFAGSGGSGLSEPVLDWRLSDGLAGFGSPVPGQQGIRCGTVNGGDLAKLLPQLKRATSITPWRSGGKLYTLIFRPLLPDESGCPGVA